MTTLLDRILRRPTNDLENPMATETPATGNVLMRFLTQGGATVELHTHAYRTHYNGLGHWTAELSDVTGSNWRCLGCDTRGRIGFQGYGSSEYGYSETEADKARDEANKHAGECRSMPKHKA